MAWDTCVFLLRSVDGMSCTHKMKHALAQPQSCEPNGLPLVQAPEIIHGIPGAASPPADIYSFGVLLWQLCTGTDPALDRKRMLE